MREDGLRAKTKGKWRPRTTQSDPKLATAPNWLGEVPHPSAINQVWVSDITYLQTDAGWHYLASVMDLCSRRIVGWAIGDSLETTLVSKALERALALRGTTPGLIHHSDRGCQYASRYYRQSLANSGITASMSRKGNCYDNAAMESFWATLKTEGFNEKELKTRRETELMVFDYVEAFYNPRRLHTGIGGMSPMEFEMKQQEQQQQQQKQNQEQQKQPQQQNQKQNQKQQQQQQHTPLN
jgi:transposase InsO family protein